MTRIEGKKPQIIDLWTLAPQIGYHIGLRFGIENQVRNGFSLIRRIAGGASATRDDHPTTEFERLAIPLLHSTYNFARWLARNDHDAEDLVQETYLKAFSNFHSFQPGSNFRAWIFRILRNTSLNSRSKLDRRMTDELNCDELSPVTTDPEDPESLLIEKSSAAAIWDAIEHLPRSSREVILLSDVEDFAYREIAEILEVPIGTVMSRLARARSAVRRALGPNQDVRIRRVADNRNGYTFHKDRMIANV
jgi:RNA polymerase sigma factor (sigma-70 family)